VVVSGGDGGVGVGSGRSAEWRGRYPGTRAGNYFDLISLYCELCGPCRLDGKAALDRERSHISHVIYDI
jgi:hypothetical protein